MAFTWEGACEAPETWEAELLFTLFWGVLMLHQGLIRTVC